MALPWSPEFELDYVRNTSKEELLARHAEHVRIFDVQNIVAEHWLGPLELVVEVGCGPFGGCLSAYLGGRRREAVDPLAMDYVRQFGMPPTLDQFYAGFAHDLPQRDGTVSLLFCIEALDHCQTLDEFRQAQSELARVLVNGGLLFFMLPARDTTKEHDGHPSNPPGSEIMAGFCLLGLTVLRHKYRREGTWLLLQKTGSLT